MNLPDLPTTGPVGDDSGSQVVTEAELRTRREDTAVHRAADRVGAQLHQAALQKLYAAELALGLAIAAAPTEIGTPTRVAFTSLGHAISEVRATVRPDDGIANNIGSAGDSVQARHDALAIALAAAHAAFEALPDATAVLNSDGQIVATNIAWRRFSVENGGTPETTDVGVNYLDVCDHAGRAEHGDALTLAAALRDVLAGTRIEAGLSYACPAPDKRRWFLAHITPLPGPNRGAIVAHRNITRATVARQNLSPLAHMVDPLTGVIARAALDVKLQTALDPTRKRGAKPDVGLIRIRLDGYAGLSAQFGRTAADETLQALASRLSAAAGEGNTVARIARTSFAVLATPTDADALEQLADRITQTAALPHHIHATPVEVATSVETHLWRAGDDPTAVLDDHRPITGS